MEKQERMTPESIRKWRESLGNDSIIQKEWIDEDLKEGLPGIYKRKAPFDKRVKQFKNRMTKIKDPRTR